jgi:predicted metal-dependent RNase
VPVDLVVSEATYGDTNLPSRKSQVQQLIGAVKQVLEQGGRVLIPTFALGRAQELILILLNHMSGRLMPTVPIYLDGLVRSLTSAFEELLLELPQALQKQADASRLSPFKRPPVQLVEDNDERIKIIESREPMIILASSGMLQGGPSPLYARAILEEPNSGLFIVGYQDEESPGRRLLELQQGGELMLPTQISRATKRSLKTGPAEKGKLGYEAVPVACSVARYYLSAHADRNGILNLLSWYPSQRAIFMHGEGGARMSLLEALRDDREVYIPHNGEAIDFSEPARYGKYNRPIQQAGPTSEPKSFAPTSAPPPPSRLKTFRSMAQLKVDQGRVTLEFPPDIDARHLFPDGLYRVNIKMGSITRAELTEVYKPQGGMVQEEALEEPTETE